MKKTTILLIIFYWISVETKSQVSINSDNSSPAPSAGLDVKFSNKGFLPPRMTYSQREAIVNPADGLMIFCTNCVPGNKGAVTYYTNGKWIILNKCITSEPIPLNPIGLPNQIIWKWNENSFATGFKWNTINDFDNAIDVGTNKFKSENGIACDTTYSRYVWAYYNCGASLPIVLTFATPVNLPVSPQAALHTPYPFQIVWKWHWVPDASGYKWNTTNNFSTAIDVGPDTAKTEFGLACISTYTRYVWAYNVCGFSSPTILMQNTSTCQQCLPFIDNRDGKDYDVIQIADQCWMAQNLNVGNKISGTYNQTDNLSIEKYCYNDLETNCDTYGGLYQWGETIQYLNGSSNFNNWYFPPTGNVQGICPEGWHLPRYSEWNFLKTFLGGYETAGGKMKEAGTIHWALPNTGATNMSGFNGLPGGCRESGYFYSLSDETFFWSIEECGCGEEAFSYSLRYDFGSLFYHNLYKIKGISIRCLKN
jgi:uncharacterized protein (TIGR02145 family)